MSEAEWRKHLKIDSYPWLPTKKKRSHPKPWGKLRLLILHESKRCVSGLSAI
jgi:hypothetical protein